VAEEPEVLVGEADADRRDFLAKAGRFALVVPPAMTLLLSTTMSSPAIAHSAGMKPGDSYGSSGSSVVDNSKITDADAFAGDILSWVKRFLSKFGLGD
jgi:hypothetical protein